MTWRRVLASIFDSALLLSLVASLPVYVVVDESGRIRVETWGPLIYLGVFSLYGAVFLYFFGATPGKQLFALRVRPTGGRGRGSKLGFLQALLREFTSIVVAWIVGPGFKASAFLRSDRRHWLDLGVHTQVEHKTDGAISGRPIYMRTAWLLIISTSLIIFVNHVISVRQSVTYENGAFFYTPPAPK